jgi:hypothetical protein
MSGQQLCVSDERDDAVHRLQIRGFLSQKRLNLDDSGVFNEIMSKLTCSND